MAPQALQDEAAGRKESLLAAVDADKRRQRPLREKPLEKVKILPLEASDIERISALAAEIWRRHYPGIIGAAQIEYMLKQRYAPQIIRAELLRHDLWWDKLLVGDAITGFVSYFLTAQPGEMKLDKLYVHQDHQRKGYGATLIGHVCLRARMRGCSRLVLAVNKNNRSAISAYRKHGFQVSTGTVKDIGGGFVMDDYIMVKAVESADGQEQ
jgi:ribosomal protein S18 acetylase RimI-like enzyme